MKQFISLGTIGPTGGVSLAGKVCRELCYDPLCFGTRQPPLVKVKPQEVSIKIKGVEAKAAAKFKVTFAVDWKKMGLEVLENTVAPKAVGVVEGTPLEMRSELRSALSARSPVGRSRNRRGCLSSSG